MAIKLRDALKQIGVNQDTGELRIKGSAILADDDQKITASGTDTKLETYEDTVSQWEKGSLVVGPASVTVGEQVTISDAGSVMVYSLKKESDVFRLSPFYKYSEYGTVQDVSIYRFIDALTVDTNDGTTNHAATLTDDIYSISTTSVAGADILVWQQKIRVGTTNPTEPVLYKVYEAIDDTVVDKLIVSMWLPITLWNGKSAGDYITFYLTSFDKKIPIQGIDGLTYYTSYESSAAFSLYGNGSKIYDGIIGNSFVTDSIILDNIVELTSTGVGTLTKDHVINATYYADTTNNPIDIKVYVDTLGSFQVNDAEMKFAINNCVVKIMNADGVTVDHTATLNFPNGSYDFIYNKDDTIWYYSEVGKGRWVAIASDHDADVDFPYEPQLPDIDLTATEANVGKVRYHTTDNSSCLDMCMQTGASTYAWVHVKENTW